MISLISDYVTPMYGTGVHTQKMDDGVNEIFKQPNNEYLVDIFDMTLSHLTTDVTINLTLIYICNNVTLLGFK